MHRTIIISDNMTEWIKLSLPHKGGSEMKWIEEAYRDDWFVPLGPHVDKFENTLSEFLGSEKPVVAVSAGTAAIHLGLVMLGVGKGDEVICQSLTFSASANPITYQGASPIFVDSEADTWNIDPVELEKAIINRKRITGKYPKAIIVVDLYGMPAKLNEIIAIANKYGIPVLEDAAEAFGSEYMGKKCGTQTQYGTLSFNGNKIITTSGGGAIVCPSEEAAARVKFLATQARENRPYYYHTVTGYNYRLSNISAAIGLGQMDNIDFRLACRRRIHEIYLKELGSTGIISILDNPTSDFNSNFWLTTAIISDKAKLSPDQLRVALMDKHIETRLLWRPMHMQPIFADAPYYGTNNVSESLFNRGLCLPSGSSLTDEQILTVCCEIKKLLI